jgi:hypothetical protein
MPAPTTITLSATPPAEPLKCAYVTFLLTSPSYLPGILLLAHTLRHPTTEPTARSAYPLIVAVNPALPGDCVKALEKAGVRVRRVEPLVPRGRVTTIAERFVDTWTKLRVWGMEEYDVSEVSRSGARRKLSRAEREYGAERLFRVQRESRTSDARRTLPSTARTKSPRVKRDYRAERLFRA